MTTCRNAFHSLVNTVFKFCLYGCIHERNAQSPNLSTSHNIVPPLLVRLLPVSGIFRPPKRLCFQSSAATWCFYFSSGSAANWCFYFSSGSAANWCFCFSSVSAANWCFYFSSGSAANWCFCSGSAATWCFYFFLRSAVKLCFYFSLDRFDSYLVLLFFSRLRSY